mmetsp:Transcript_35792/g.26115  ORF Transcript_35792/g.26115 Transcript_35792/m.26115 type:complete len:276 (-) Transcript_35792:3671-4498(-)
MLSLRLLFMLRVYRIVPKKWVIIVLSNLLISTMACSRQISYQVFVLNRRIISVTCPFLRLCIILILLVVFIVCFISDDITGLSDILAAPRAEIISMSISSASLANDHTLTISYLMIPIIVIYIFNNICILIDHVRLMILLIMIIILLLLIINVISKRMIRIIVEFIINIINLEYSFIFQILVISISIRCLLSIPIDIISSSDLSINISIIIIIITTIVNIMVVIIVYFVLCLALNNVNVQICDIVEEWPTRIYLNNVVQIFSILVKHCYFEWGYW